MAGSQKSTYTPKSSDTVSSVSQYAAEMPKPRVVETEIPSRINIQSLQEAHLVYSGQATGQRYEWLRAGAIVSVDEADVSNLLEKRLGGRLCCGGDDSNNRLFQVVK